MEIMYRGVVGNREVAVVVERDLRLTGSVSPLYICLVVLLQQRKSCSMLIYNVVKKRRVL